MHTFEKDLISNAKRRRFSRVPLAQKNDPLCGLTNASYSSLNRAITNRAETIKAETNCDEINWAETYRAGTNRVETNRAGTNRAETNRTETNIPIKFFELAPRARKLIFY